MVMLKKLTVLMEQASEQVRKWGKAASSFIWKYDLME